MIFAGIVAGGCGSRVKSAVIPKQFIEIGGVPVIIRTVRAFLAVEEIDMVYVGIKPDWHDYTDELFERFGIDKERVRVIDGGTDRNGTVMNIAEAIVAEHGENEALLPQHLLGREFLHYQPRLLSLLLLPVTFSKLPVCPRQENQGVTFLLA